MILQRREYTPGSAPRRRPDESFSLTQQITAGSFERSGPSANSPFEPPVLVVPLPRVVQGLLENLVSPTAPSTFGETDPQMPRHRCPKEPDRIGRVRHGDAANVTGSVICDQIHGQNCRIERLKDRGRVESNHCIEREVAFDNVPVLRLDRPSITRGGRTHRSSPPVPRLRCGRRAGGWVGGTASSRASSGRQRSTRARRRRARNYSRSARAAISASFCARYWRTSSGSAPFPRRPSRARISFHSQSDSRGQATLSQGTCKCPPSGRSSQMEERSRGSKRTMRLVSGSTYAARASLR